VATTNTYSGSLAITGQFAVAFTTDTLGGRLAKIAETISFAASGGTAPTVSGFVHGTLTVSAGDILLAHATDPFQSMGDAAYSDGFTVASSKIKMVWIKNTDTTNNVTIARGAANGCPIFDAAGDSVTLAPGDEFLFYKKAGTAALTTGSNDKLTLTPSAGSPTLEMLVAYGP
jgi:hypothetical protein